MADQWSADGASLYSRRFGEAPGEIAARIYRLELSRRRKELWKEILPPEGDQGVGTVHLTPDGKSYAYIYICKISHLYLADGLK